jgi:hypothetical protein
MTKLFNLRTLIGIALIAVALWPTKAKVEVALLDIEKPTPEIVQLVAPISELITDPTDRAKLAIFNQAFANRVKGYDADTQQVNDVYVLAGQTFFKDSIVDKYRELDTKLVSLMEKAMGGDNHKLTAEEQNLLSSYFMGLAWSLIQKR